MSTPTPVEPTDPFWRDRAHCRDSEPELFFPTAPGGLTRGEVNFVKKRFCGPCPVSGECLHNAIVNDENYGIWGGTSEPERRKIARQYPALRKAAARRQQLREEVARLGGQGLTPQMIAGALNITERTARHYLTTWRAGQRESA